MVSSTPKPRLPPEIQGIYSHYIATTVDGRNLSRTTLKPRETTVCWYFQGNHHSMVSQVMLDFVHPQYVRSIYLNLCVCFRVELPPISRGWGTVRRPFRMVLISKKSPLGRSFQGGRGNPGMSQGHATMPVRWIQHPSVWRVCLLLSPNGTANRFEHVHTLWRVQSATAPTK